MDDGDAGIAAQNLDVFLGAARERGAVLAGEPVRDPAADRDGRFAWSIPLADNSVIRLLMPGVELARVRGTTADAPCLFLTASGDPPGPRDAWWWPDALGLLAASARWSTDPRQPTEQRLPPRHASG